MFIIPILIFIGVVVLILSLIGGVVYAVIHKNQKNEDGVEIPSKQIHISEMISNFFGFGLLVTNIVSITVILFTVIDEIFKDEISKGAPSMYYNYNNYSDLHSSIALVLITLPLSLALSYWIRKEHIKVITEGNSPVKKFTIGATVIASLISICGSLFTIVYQYLEGDISSRFVAKVISVFVLSAILFAYYRLIYVKGQLATIKYQNIFGAASSLFVIGLCIYSIALTGNPAQIRKEKFDDIRLSNLSSIQQNVLSYWQSHLALPVDLPTMSDSLNGTSIPKDPRSGDSYEYKIIKQSVPTDIKIGEPSFEVCATFETKRDTSAKYEELKTKDLSRYNSIVAGEFNSYYPMDEAPFWNHKAERTCFTRTIDPVKYLPQQPQPVQMLRN